MIIKKREFGKIEVLPDGVIQLREDSVFLEDDKEIFRFYNRRVLEPADTNSETEERLVKIISVIWTKEVIEEYKKKKVQNESGTSITSRN